MEDAGDALTANGLERLVGESGGIREYAKRLEMDARRAPYDPASYCRAALMQAEAGRHGRAVRLLREVLRSDPDNAPALAIMGTAYTYAGRPARAARLCSRAIRLDPSLSFAYYMRGKAMAKLGRPRAALRMFRAAVRLDPDDYDSHESMGLALAMEGRHMRAAACYVKDTGFFRAGTRCARTPRYEPRTFPEHSTGCGAECGAEQRGTGQAGAVLRQRLRDCRPRRPRRRSFRPASTRS